MYFCFKKKETLPRPYYNCIFALIKSGEHRGGAVKHTPIQTLHPFTPSFPYKFIKLLELYTNNIYHIYQNADQYTMTIRNASV